MGKRMRTIGFFVSACLFLVTGPSHAATHVVHIFDHTAEQSMVFEPFYLKIDVGDTVEFKSDSAGHITQSVFVPEGANTWKGQPNEKVSSRFNKEGVYIYECRFHGSLGMTGVIQAGKALNLKEARAFYLEYRNKLLMNRERVDAIIDSLE
jgi:pseudoazurin